MRPGEVPEGSAPASARAAAEPRFPEDAPPSRLGPYRLTGVLGRGAQAIVYAAVQEELDRPAAVKVLSPRGASDPDFTERFHREALISARLNHPNIVTVYDTGEHAGRPWLAMEMVDGRSVGALLRAEGRLRPMRALSIARDVARALDHAAAHGVLHRDVKPQNVLIDAEGIVKLSDLGLAKDHNAPRLTKTGMVLGTPRYMSPELILGQQPDVRSDIYSLGIMTFEMLTGAPPHEETGGVVATMMRHTEEDVPEPSLLSSGVSPTIDAVVALMTARDRDGRYPDAAALIGDLEALLAGKLPPFAASHGKVTLVEPTEPMMPAVRSPVAGPARRRPRVASSSSAIRASSERAVAAGRAAIASAGGSRALLLIGGGGLAFIATVTAVAVALALGGEAPPPPPPVARSESPRDPPIEPEEKRPRVTPHAAHPPQPQQRRDQTPSVEPLSEGVGPPPELIPPPPDVEATPADEPPAAAPAPVDPLDAAIADLARLGREQELLEGLARYRALEVGEALDRLAERMRGRSDEERAVVWAWTLLDRAFAADPDGHRRAEQELARAAQTTGMGNARRLASAAVGVAWAALAGDPRAVAAIEDAPDAAGGFLARGPLPQIAELRRMPERWIQQTPAAAPPAGAGGGAAPLGRLDAREIDARVAAAAERIALAVAIVPPDGIARLHERLGRAEERVRAAAAAVSEAGVLRFPGDDGASLAALDAQPAARWKLERGALVPTAPDRPDRATLAQLVGLRLRVPDFGRFGAVKLTVDGPTRIAFALVGEDGEPRAFGTIDGRTGQPALAAGEPRELGRALRDYLRETTTRVRAGEALADLAEVGTCGLELEMVRRRGEVRVRLLRSRQRDQARIDPAEGPLALEIHPTPGTRIRAVELRLAGDGR